VWTPLWQAALCCDAQCALLLFGLHRTCFTRAMDTIGRYGECVWGKGTCLVKQGL
jgi:hypothetical protein